MGKFIRWASVVLMMMGLVFTAGPSAWAKKEGGEPAGWHQGKKTGWQGADEPPGFEKKEEGKKKKHHPKKHKKEEKKEEKKEGKKEGTT